MVVAACLLVLLCSQMTLQQVPVSWVHSNSIISGTFTVNLDNIQLISGLSQVSGSTASTSNNTITTMTYYTYDTPWWRTTSSTLSSIISICGMHVDSTTGLVVVDANIGTMTTTTHGSLIGIASVNHVVSTIFTTLAIDLSVFSSIQLGSAMITTPGPLNTGSGNRNYTITGLSVTVPITLSNTIVAIPFITGYALSKASSPDYYALSLSMTINTATTFSLVISTESSCLITFLRYSWIIFDKTAFEASRLDFADVGTSTWSAGSQTSTISLTSAKNQCFFVGLNSMVAVASSALRFSQTMSNPYSMTTLGASIISVSSINFRERSCPAANPYYRIFDDICYPACPSYTLQSNVFYSCEECHYSCYNCTAVASALGCNACSATDFRTISVSSCPCNPNYYDAGTSICVACDPTCLTCSGSLASNCLSCNSTKLLTQSGSSCICSSIQTFYLGTCTPCSSLQAGCLYCTGTTCTTCDSSLHRVTDGASGCTCGPAYAINNVNTCQPCSSYIVGCLTCSSNSTCSTCNPALGFLLVGTSCSCSSGLAFVGGQCLDKCGDGMVVSLSCDDGNLISGDGCSATCNPEVNYTCHTLSLPSPSICSYNQPLFLTFQSLWKEPQSNSLTIKFLISPALPVLSQFNFLQILTSSLPQLTISSASYNNGEVTVTATYNSSIQGSQLVLGIVPPTTLINTFAMQSSSLSLLVAPANGAAIFYAVDTYAQSRAIAIILKVCACLGLVLFITGQVFRGLIGAELMNVLQLVFLSVCTSSNVPPSSAAVSELSGFVNGFIYRSIPTTTVQPALSAMSMTNQFLGSCNIMLLLQLFVLIIGGILWIVNMKVNPQVPDTLLKRLSVFFLNEIFLIWTLFNMLNLAFSTGVYIRAEVGSSAGVAEHLSNWICIVIGLTMATVSLYSSFSKFSFPECSELLKDELTAQWKLASFHPAFLCIHKLLMGLIMGLAYGTVLRGLAPLILQLAYSIYCIVQRPYKKLLETVRLIVNELALLVIFILSFVDSLVAFQQLSTALAWGQTTLVMVCVLTTYCCYIHQIFKQYCAQKPHLKTYPVNKKVETEANVVEEPNPDEKLDSYPEDAVPKPKPMMIDLPKLRTKRPEKKLSKKVSEEIMMDDSLEMREQSTLELIQAEQGVIYI